MLNDPNILAATELAKWSAILGLVYAFIRLTATVVRILWDIHKVIVVFFAEHQLLVEDYRRRYPDHQEKIYTILANRKANSKAKGASA